VAVSIDALDAGCGGGFTAQGWHVHVGADGTIEQSSYDLIHPTAPVRTQVPVERVQALFARAESAGLMRLQLQDGGDYGCSLTLSVGPTRHTLIWGPTHSQGSAKARAICNQSKGW